VSDPQDELGGLYGACVPLRLGMNRVSEVEATALRPASGRLGGREAEPEGPAIGVHSIWAAMVLGRDIADVVVVPETVCTGWRRETIHCALWSLLPCLAVR